MFAVCGESAKTTNAAGEFGSDTVLQRVVEELDNWARWGRDRVDPDDIPPPSVWNAWIEFNGRVAGWGLTAAEQVAQEQGEFVEIGDAPGPPPIDVAAAVATDRKMRYLADNHPETYRALHRYFYDWFGVLDRCLFKAMHLFAGLA